MEKNGKNQRKEPMGMRQGNVQRFFKACFAIPFNLPLVGFWSNVACFDWKKRLHGYPKIQTPKRCNSSGSGHKKIRVDSLMSNMYVADKATE